MSNKIQIQFNVLVSIIFLAAMSRLIPHMQNFSPVCALGLFGAAHFDKKWKALLIPIAATLLSDVFISQFIHSNHPFFYIGIEWQYISYFLIVLIGFRLFKKVNALTVTGGIVASTLVFYLVTNLGCWPGNPIYTQDMNGLMTCMIAGLPFVKGTLMSNLVYSVLLFGGYALLQNRFEILRSNQLVQA